MPYKLDLSPFFTAWIKIRLLLLILLVIPVILWPEAIRSVGELAM